MRNFSAASLQVQVKEKRVVAAGVVALTLARVDGGRLPDWTPGAHVDLILPNGTSRQYSLCGDRWQAHLFVIAVQREEGGRGGSAYVHDVLQEGDLVALGGPRNSFPLDPSPRYLFIAGGIGITPLVPMIQQADMVGSDWTLLYGGRTRASMAFADEFAEHGDRVVVVPQDEQGLLPLRAYLDRVQPGDRVYCCGPAPLLAAVEQECRDMPPYTLHIERFTARDAGKPARSTAFEVVLGRSGRIVTVPPERSVLDALRGAGVDLLSSCHEGLCGTCETGLLDGEPDHRDSLLSDAERARNDVLFPCVSRALSDRLVLDL